MRYNCRMFQFGIRTLLIITTIVALLVWALFAPPQWVGLWALAALFFAIPPVTVAGVLFHHGYYRAFFAGMAPWAIAVWYWFGYYAFNFELFEVVFYSDIPDAGAAYDEQDIVRIKLALAPILLVILTSGLISMGIYWWSRNVENRGKPPSG